jgi:cation transport ATPase
MLSLDEIRPQAVQMVNAMKNMNFKVTMLTGDHDKVAMQVYNIVYYLVLLDNIIINIIIHILLFVSKVCNACGIEDCKSRLLPYEKLEWIRNADKTTNGVIMIGDGINDASALAGNLNTSK